MILKPLCTIIHLGMPTENIMYPCSVCQKQTVHIQRRINHILHLLLSVLFVGLWLIVWVCIAMFGTRTPVCTVCGNGSTSNIATPEPKKEITSEDRKGFVKFIVILLGVFLFFFLYATGIWDKIPALRDIIN